MVGAKTYSLMSDLVAPAKPATKTYADLVAVVKGHLKPKPLVIAERFKFHCRNQGESESVAQYMVELRKLADKCHFEGYLEEALRDRLVCGLRNEAIQRRLLTIDGLNLDNAYKTAHGMETAQQHASQLQASSNTVNFLKKKKPFTKPLRSNQPSAWVRLLLSMWEDKPHS